MVDELHGDEGGTWQVHTQGSTHVLDLDQMTVTRIPGPTATIGINDTTRPIRTIDHCQVGRRGYWTMFADDPDDTIDCYWQLTSIIRCIERIGDDDIC